MAANLKHVVSAFICGLWKGKEKLMTGIPKNAQVVDTATGEALTNDALAERMRMVLAKQIEIVQAEEEVTACETAVDRAKEALGEARAKVLALESECRDIINGQKLLF